MATSPDVVTKYRAGFNECANEIMRYLTSAQGVNDEVRTRVLSHLANCLQAINPINDVMQHPGHVMGVPVTQHPAFVTACAPPTNPSAFQTLITEKMPLSQQNNLQVPASCLTSSQTTATPFQLIPGTLPGGQVALVLTSPSSVQAVPLYATPAVGSDRKIEPVNQVKSENISPLPAVRVPKVFTSQPEIAPHQVAPSPQFGNHGNNMLSKQQPEVPVRNAPSPEQVWRPW